jgi:hypothetical protein
MTEKTNQHQDTDQPDNWLVHVFEQRNFTPEVLNRIPTLEGAPLGAIVNDEIRWEHVKKDGLNCLISLLQDRNSEVRENAAISLSKCSDPSIKSVLFEIASKRSNIFTHRQAAIQALSASGDNQVQEYLVNFLIDYKQSLSFNPNMGQAQIKKNFYHGQAEAEHKNLIPNAEARMRNRKALLSEAASAIGEIRDESILKQLGSISSSNLVQRFWEKLNGITHIERELRLNHVLKALQNQIKVKSEYPSKLILEGFKSETREIRQNAVIAAYVNPSVINDKTKLAVLQLLRKDPSLFEESEMMVYFGGILAGSDNPKIKEELRNFIISDSPLNKQIGLMALRGSKDVRDIDYAANVLERTTHPKEEYLAIKVLGEFIDRGKDVNNPGFDQAESILLHNFKFFIQKSDANRAALMLALKNSNDKAFTHTCIDLLFTNNSVLYSAASSCLMHNPSRELNESLLGILNIKDEDSRSVVGGVCKILCHRLDSTSTSHLIKY